ncbi:DUF3011 domain-containing protein [Stenotrophomonas sp. 24(2023)]|uniref:DUF3011 domain-containing protein n=1 Tax=Stenotrophomonas sp. 24(2023) TaxID=3068324 RepID=UPI0031BBBA19
MGKGSAWHRTACLLLPLMAVAGVAQAQAYGYGDGYRDNGYGGRGDPGIVRCESNGGRSSECALEGRPRLIRQLSNTPCVEGENWGASRRGVWVTQGCRAEFIGDYRRGREGRGGWRDDAQVISCDSNKNRWNQCRVSIRREARLIRQESRTACIEGQTWGWDSRGVWVDGGCRGQFQVR